MPPSISISTGSDRVSISARAAADLVEHLGDERLAAEAGVHAHHEQQVDLGEVRLHRVVRRLRLERQTDAHAELPDLVEQRPRIAELDVDRATVGAGIGEAGQQHLRVVDHQVAVEEQVGVLAQRLHDRRPDA